MKGVYFFFLKAFSLFLGLLIHGLYKLRCWTLKNPKSATITYLVIGTHFFAIIWFAVKRNAHIIPKSHSQLVVNTRIEKPPPPRKPPPARKPVQRKAVAQKKPPAEPRKARAPVSKTTQKKKELLKNIEKSLAKIDDPPQKNKAPSLSIPKSLEKNDSPREATQEEVFDYQSILVSFLRQNLSFPHTGEVKVKLFVQPDGFIHSFKIFSSTSKENEEYLKNKLPLLKVPCFNREAINSKELSFLITFSGE